MKKALLYKKLANNAVQCYVCQRKCVIPEGKTGFCGTRKNQKGELYTLIYGIASSVNIDPIEKKPLFHFHPGTQVLSLGTYGCNFRCLFCQNWNLTYLNGKEIKMLGGASEKITPKKVIELLEKSDSAGVAFTYNEPAIWLEFNLDVMKEIKEHPHLKKYYTVYVTNGFLTKEHLDLIGPYLDAFRVDIKSFDDKFYQKVANIPQVKGILEVTKRAKDKWKMHVEVVTNIVPTMNDSPENLKKIANWIVKNLGPEIPWHVTRFFPQAKLQDLPPTPLKTLKKAQEIGKKAGLKHVYLGNI